MTSSLSVYREDTSELIVTITFINIKELFRVNLIWRASKEKQLYHLMEKKLIQLDMTQIMLQETSDSVMSDSWQPYGLQPSRLLCPWNSPGKNAAVGYYFLLQGIYLPRDSTCLLHCRQILYHLSHQLPQRYSG